MKKLMVFLSLILAVALPVQGKAYYATRQEMVHRAEVIAVVEIGEIQQVQLQGDHWTYGECAEARVEQCLKGQLPERITLVGRENFICAQVGLRRGRCLVFLKKDKPGYAGCNWAASCLPVDGSGKVPWLPTAESRQIGGAVPLEQAQSDIKRDLTQRPRR